jgi:hydrogenase nickel incorporation protein HypA/HybF
MITQVETIARAHGARGVRRVYLSIGPLSGVEPQLLAQAFPLACAGTVAQQAELNIESLPVRVHCDTCGEETPARPNRLVCGVCGDWHTRIISGDELLLTSVELIKNQVQDKNQIQDTRGKIQGKE